MYYIVYCICPPLGFFNIYMIQIIQLILKHDEDNMSKHMIQFLKDQSIYLR